MFLYHYLLLYEIDVLLRTYVVERNLFKRSEKMSNYTVH